MSGSSHTPRPWRVAPIFRENSPTVFGVFGPRTTKQFNGESIAECWRKENAERIAALPDLLAALRDFVEYLSPGEDATVAMMLDDARGAIAKAVQP